MRPRFGLVSVTRLIRHPFGHTEPAGVNERDLLIAERNFSENINERKHEIKRNVLDTCTASVRERKRAIACIYPRVSQDSASFDDDPRGNSM